MRGQSDLPVSAAQGQRGAWWPSSDSLHPGSATEQEAPGEEVGGPPKRRWLERRPAVRPPKQLEHTQL